MNYKVEYSYKKEGKRVYEKITSWAESAQQAARNIEYYYDDLDDFKIEEIWKDNGNCWAKVDEVAWNY